MARFSVSDGLRGAYCSAGQRRLCARGARPTRMLGVCVCSPAISFARSAVEEKARAAVERAAVANGRLAASRIAIACGCGAGDCAVQRGAGNGVVAGEGVVEDARY